MYTISHKIPMMELKTYTKVVAAVFCLSAATAFSLSLLRVVKPEYFYGDLLLGTDNVLNYLISSLLVVASAIGFLNSCVVIHRKASDNTGRNITTWLLLDSLFETSRVVYLFVCELMLKGYGDLQFYELLLGCAQYLLDSCLYCQMILRH